MIEVFRVDKERAGGAEASPRRGLERNGAAAGCPGRRLSERLSVMGGQGSGGMNGERQLFAMFSGKH